MLICSVAAGCAHVAERIALEREVRVVSRFCSRSGLALGFEAGTHFDRWALPPVSFLGIHCVPACPPSPSGR
jgi:hypothetical protein